MLAFFARRKENTALAVLDLILTLNSSRIAPDSYRGQSFSGYNNKV